MSKPEVVDPAKVGATLVAMGDRPPLSVAVVDIDEFAAINESHGRTSGDAIIELVRGALCEGLEGAFVVRSGGDEFLCAFPETSPEQALLRMEAIRLELEQPRRIGNSMVSVPISIGIASFPHHAEEPANLADAAQAALHKAKSDGRNRATIYVEEKMVLKSNYYSRAQLAQLARLAHVVGRTEASLLREALANLLDRHRDLT